MTISATARLPPPAFSICFLYSSLIDRSTANQQLSKTDQDELSKIPEIDVMSQTHFYVRKFTIGQILKLLPNIKFNQCRIRLPMESNVNSYESEKECMQFFTTSKTFFQEYACYRTQTTFKDMYDYFQVGKAMHFQGLAFQMTVPYQFINRTTISLPFLHTTNGKGDRSRLSAGLVSMSNDINFVRLSYAMNSEKRLPPPYVTKCNGRGASQCFRECSLQSFKNQFGKLPFMESYTETEVRLNDGHLFDTNLLYNKTNNDLMNAIRKNCLRHCPISCEIEFYITEIQHTAKYSFINVSGFRVDLPRWPATHIEHRPSLEFNEYVIYVTSCLGTWLGISIINLNPFSRLKCPCMRTESKPHSHKINKGKNRSVVIRKVMLN